jgi:hypothetical protein
MAMEKDLYVLMRTSAAAGTDVRRIPRATLISSWPCRRNSAAQAAARTPNSSSSRDIGVLHRRAEDRQRARQDRAAEGHRRRR